MKRVGLTGAAGFVGANLVGRLLDEGADVVGVDDLSYGAIANIAPYLDHPGFHFETVDCTKQRLLRKAFDGCDAIVHLAAKKIPRFGGALSTLEVNVAGVNAACAVALALDADIIVTSTSDVYGDGTPPYAEDDPLVIGPPTSRRWAYAVSKMYDEHVALALAEERGLRTTVLRLFNAYGPYNHRSWWGGPTSTFIEALLDGEPMEIHGDGQQTRTFTYISDTVDGFMRALRTPAARGEVINIGGTQTRSIQQLAAAIQAKMGIAGPLRATFVPYEALPGNYQDVRDRVPETRKAKALLGFKARVSLDEGLERTIAWYAQQRRAQAASS